MRFPEQRMNLLTLPPVFSLIGLGVLAVLVIATIHVIRNWQGL